MWTKAQTYGVAFKNASWVAKSVWSLNELLLIMWLQIQICF